MKNNNTKYNKNTNKPVNVNKDVWFYVNPKSFDFVVYAIGKDGKRVCTQFRLFNRKIQKYFPEK